MPSTNTKDGLTEEKSLNSMFTKMLNCQCTVDRKTFALIETGDRRTREWNSSSVTVPVSWSGTLLFLGS